MRQILEAALLSVLLLSGLAGCKTGETEPPEPTAEAAIATADACICGTERGDLIGCYCEDCLLNGGNPRNPDCTCLPLAPAEELERTFVSMGGSSRPRMQGGLVGLEELQLRKGGRVKGEVLEDDGESILFRVEGGGEVTYTYEDLDHRMVYRLLKAKSSKGNAEDELKLATYARDCGLHAHSRRHYANVLSLEPELQAEVDEGLAELRRRASQEELAKAREAYDAGDVAGAREHLATVLNEFPDEDAAGSAAAMLAEISVDVLGGVEPHTVGGMSAQQIGELVPIAERYDQAALKNREGLQGTKNPARARSAYEAALSEAERARKELAQLGGQSGQDAAFQEAVRSYDQQLIDLLVDIHLNLASLYQIRGSYDDALAEANAALALDATNERALAMRARVETNRDSYREGYRAAQRQTQQYGIGLYPYRFRYGYYPGGSISIGRISGYGVWGGQRLAPVPLRR